MTPFILIKGCRQHNLKNLTLSLPKHQVIVITGVSGSGKSSLAFDTLYAESQRRFLEYLSPPIRKWVRQLPRPEVDLIENLSPAVAIDQHRRALSQLGTVATYTDLYDFLSLLFARIGQQHSPITGKPLLRFSRQQIAEQILADYPEGTKLQLIAPCILQQESPTEAIQRLQKQGFIRLRVEGKEIGDEIPALEEGAKIEVVIDRIQIREGIYDRLSSSIETALNLSQGVLFVQEGAQGPLRPYTEIYLCIESGLRFSPLVPADFNPQSPRGACENCKGKGCSSCSNSGLKATALACLIQGQNIAQLCARSILSLLEEIQSWTFTGPKQTIAAEIVPEILSRLTFLKEVGLGYLELNRSGGSLSEGEAQRVQLASLVGARLSGILYILDEPSRGLHCRDVKQLAPLLSHLTLLGNSVILVEHNKELICHADQILELGPGAGRFGGEVVFQGSLEDIRLTSHSPTGKWLSSKKQAKPPKRRKHEHGALHVKQASLHYLKQVTVAIPFGVCTGLYGVSGSGKSTLALDIIAKELQNWLQHATPCPSLENYEKIQRISVVEQQTAGVMARSIPATYIDLMTPLRELFSQTKLARARGYTPARFTLNRKGGRCEMCEGLGWNRVDMGFLSDLYLPCSVCEGKRFNYETLQVLWEGFSIADILDMQAERALQLFQHFPDLAKRLQLMVELGLDYLTLGQSFTTLSGGEMQRLKLISELAKPHHKPTFFIMDEPCVGLHPTDVLKLAAIFNRLVEAGNTLLVIEHNLDLLAACDWVIEMGPEGGPKGGEIVFEGTPEKLRQADTATGKVLRE